MFEKTIRALISLCRSYAFGRGFVHSKKPASHRDGMRAAEFCGLPGRSERIPLLFVEYEFRIYWSIRGAGSLFKCSKSFSHSLQEVLELIPEENGSFAAEVVARHETSDAVMNSTICHIKDSRHLFLAAGIEDMCEMYRVKYTIQAPKFSNGAVKNHDAAINKGIGYYLLGPSTRDFVYMYCAQS